MIKRFLVAIVGLLVVIGLIAGIKVLQIRKMISAGGQYSPPPETVTTAEVSPEFWESTIQSIGSLEAVQGVTVTTEIQGRVEQISFEPGTLVKAGDLLVRLDTSTEVAQLRAAEAAAALAEANLARIREVSASGGIARADLDNAEAKCKESRAQVDAIRATIAKKNIRAPFGGRLGIRLVNLGQVLSEGDPVVSLQSLDPIFVNFQLPQQQLPLVTPGLTVRLSIDDPKEAQGDGTGDGAGTRSDAAIAVEGRITTINPEIDPVTRNFLVQATLANPDESLRPGMFVNVAVIMPAKKEVLAIPATSVLYAPYGDSVFVVDETKDETTGETGKILRQQFVRLGEKRGDYVAVLSGLKSGETVVTTGVFKLRNGQAVVFDNTLSPEFKLTPTPPDT